MCAQATRSSDDCSKEVITEGAGWTIISTDKAEYCFCEPPTLTPGGDLVSTRPVLSAVTPVPLVQRLQLAGGGSEGAMLELEGEGFSPSLQVWLGDVAAETLYRCQESLLCRVPDLAAFDRASLDSLRAIYGDRAVAFTDSDADDAPKLKDLRVPVLLVRTDGLIFNTGLTFSYALELDAKHGIVATHAIPVVKSDYPPSDAESTASSSESMDAAPADRTADPDNQDL